MRNNLLVMLALCASVCMVCAKSLMAQAVPTIDSILLANEFKAEQRSQLNLLPLSSVAELTQLLNGVASDDAQAGRLFEFLALKVRQFEAELSKATREAAIETLKLKIKSATAPVTEYRQSLLKSLEAMPQALDRKMPQLLEQSTKLQAAAPTPHESNHALSIPKDDEPTASSIPWSLIALLIVAGIGLVVFLLKRRS